MNRSEFLDILRQSLEGEVSPDIIEQNIKYYDEYINTHSFSGEEAVLSELGNPRLIAKTIIESERIAKEKSKNIYGQGYSGERNRNNTEDTSEERDKWENNRGNRSGGIFFTGLKWYHKAVLFAVLLIILIALLFIGRVIISLLYVFAVPIILMFLLFSLFRRR
jgi:uncharacterized membrane protein